MVSFYALWKALENLWFSDVSGGMERDQWHEMD